MDQSFHLVEQAIDYHRKFGEGIADVPIREPFMQIPGDDALNPLVDLRDTLLGTSSQRHTDRKAKNQRGNQAERERTTDDPCDLPDFIDISSNHQHVSVRQTSRYQADRLFLSTTFVYPADHSALYRIV